MTFADLQFCVIFASGVVLVGFRFIRRNKDIKMEMSRNQFQAYVFMNVA